MIGQRSFVLDIETFLAQRGFRSAPSAKTVIVLRRTFSRLIFGRAYALKLAGTITSFYALTDI